MEMEKGDVKCDEENAQT